MCEIGVIIFFFVELVGIGGECFGDGFVVGFDVCEKVSGKFGGEFGGVFFDLFLCEYVDDDDGVILVCD